MTVAATKLCPKSTLGRTIGMLKYDLPLLRKQRLGISPINRRWPIKETETKPNVEWSISQGLNVHIVTSTEDPYIKKDHLDRKLKKFPVQSVAKTQLDLVESKAVVGPQLRMH